MRRVPASRQNRDQEEAEGEITIRPMMQVLANLWRSVTQQFREHILSPEASWRVRHCAFACASLSVLLTIGICAVDASFYGSKAREVGTRLLTRSPQSVHL